MSQGSLLLVLLTLLLASLPLFQARKRALVKCGQHEVQVDCVEPCQPSCSWPDRPSCPSETCTKGCHCAEGFMRAYNETDTPCTKCKKKVTHCGKNEVLSTCVNPCQPSCSWKDRPACSTFRCSDGCDCRENYYRANNETHSSCIKCK